MTKAKTKPKAKAKARGKRKPNESRTATLRALQVKDIATRYLAGQYQHTIAQELGISLMTVKRELAELRAEWLASALVDFDEAKAIQLKKVDLVEAAAWEQFVKSCGPNLTRTVTVTDAGEYPGETITEQTKELLGDPRFLAIIMQCVERRAKILGLDAPVKVAETNAQGQDVDRRYKDMSNEEIQRRIDELRAANERKSVH